MLAAQKRAAAVRSKDRRLFLMSDSVMLGAESTLPKALPTWKVNLDGKESRFFPAGLDVLAARRKEIGQVVGDPDGQQLRRQRAEFREPDRPGDEDPPGVRWVVFVTVFEYRPEQAEVNNELRAAAAPLPNIRVADWNTFERANPGHTSHDGLHLKPSGALLMAGVGRLDGELVARRLELRSAATVIAALAEAADDLDGGARRAWEWSVWVRPSRTTTTSSAGTQKMRWPSKPSAQNVPRSSLNVHQWAPWNMSSSTDSGGRAWSTHPSARMRRPSQTPSRR